MHTLILWCGFFGAWSLFAGPVYQAALELDEEEVARDAMETAAERLPPSPRPSPWWWLIPPIGYVLARRRSQQRRQQVLALLTDEEMRSLVAFMNKATGWLLVALGALLIAVKETWELAEHLEWPHWVFWVLIVAMGAAATSFTVSRMAWQHEHVPRA